MARLNGGSPDPADVLRELIENLGPRAPGATKGSARALAKQLVGAKATDKEWENQRREVTEWLRGRRNGGVDPSDKSLDQIADVLKVPRYLLRLLYRQADLNEAVAVHLEAARAALGLEEDL